MAEPLRNDEPVPSTPEFWSRSSDSGLAPPSGDIVDRVVDGRYRIVRPIARGGMGVVCEAVHQTTGGRVALKLLSIREREPVTGLGADDQSLERAREHVSRFHREARAAAALDTQHIVQVFDTGTDSETDEPYLAMELLVGEDLKHLIERIDVLAAEVAARIVLQACRGLAKAHAAGIVHRDIKPGNLYLAERDDGEVVVKILDFGIAKVQSPTDDAGTDLTRTGSILGSPHYMSPEQAQGLKTIDERADIWSLGVVLHKLLSGRTPHDDAESTGQLLVLICTEDPEPLADIAPWVTKGLADVVERALERKPEDRFASVQQLLDALLPFAGDTIALHLADFRSVPEEVRQSAPRQERRTDDVETLPSRPLGTPVELDTGGTEGDGRSAEPVADRVDDPLVPPGRRRWPVVLAAAAGLLLLVIVGWRYWIRAAPADDGRAALAGPTAGAPATPDAEIRTVRLAIEPDRAKVTVDGETLEVQDGGVELSGKIGSTHRVRLEAGEQSHEVTVAITERGALPEQVALNEHADRGIGGSDGSAVGTSTSPPGGGPHAGSSSVTVAAPAGSTTAEPTTPAASSTASSKWNDKLEPSDSLD